MMIHMVKIWTDDVKNENKQQGSIISTRDLLLFKPFCGGIGIGLPTHMEVAFQVDMYHNSSLIAFVIDYRYLSQFIFDLHLLIGNHWRNINQRVENIIKCNLTDLVCSYMTFNETQVIECYGMSFGNI